MPWTVSNAGFELRRAIDGRLPTLAKFMWPAELSSGVLHRGTRGLVTLTVDDVSRNFVSIVS